MLLLLLFLLSNFLSLVTSVLLFARSCMFYLHLSCTVYNFLLFSALLCKILTVILTLIAGLDIILFDLVAVLVVDIKGLCTLLKIIQETAQWWVHLVVWAGNKECIQDLLFASSNLSHMHPVPASKYFQKTSISSSFHIILELKPALLTKSNNIAIFPV